jgi:hypothetical protein
MNFISNNKVANLRYVRNLLIPIHFMLLVGCGAPVNYFPARLGQSWDMRADDTGDITHFEITNAPTNNHTDPINIHITKYQTRAYWEPGLDGAEVWWSMRQLKDGRWVSDYSISNFNPPNLMRNDYLHHDPNSYMVVPPTQFKPGDYVGYSTDTWCRGDAFCPSKWLDVMWIARISYAKVNTPVYTGTALLNEEFECGIDTPMGEIDNPALCAHELWYFAAGIGLVEIDPVWSGTPPIKRIN